jgi:hypothetical protein
MTETSKAVSVPRSMRAVTSFASCYLGLSLLTLVAAALFRGDPGVLNQSEWARGVLAAAGAIAMLIFVLRAQRGSRGAFLCLRIASALLLAATVAVLLILGLSPLWMRIEQTACAVLLIGTVSMVNGSGLRTAFAWSGPRTASVRSE